MIADALEWLLWCFRHFARTNMRGLVMVAALGVVLGALCWFVASRYSRLWNVRYRARPGHHVLCGLAAAATVAFTLGFAAVRYAREAALGSIDRWHTDLQHDQRWSANTFRRAYYSVQKLGLEDFAMFPTPEVGGSAIPLNDERSRVTTAGIYADGACAHFRSSRAFLSLVLWPRSALPRAIVENDVRRWFALGNHVYPAEQAITLVARKIKEQLDSQTPRVVKLARLAAVLALLVCQAVPFSLIGWAAYRDIRVDD